MPEDDAGKGLDLDIAQRVLLDFGEPADLLLGKPDVIKVGPIHSGKAVLDLLFRQPEVSPLPAIETD